MSVWENYTEEQRNEYVHYLQVFGALSELFRQKKGRLIPHLDSKFQETIFAKVFKSKIVDVGNTPHDILSVIGGKRIGIGLKTWMDSKPSFQKVMQLKRFQTEINELRFDEKKLAYKISELKNEKMKRDYERLGLSEKNNIYHYVTRDESSFVIHECSYPLIDIKNLIGFELNEKSFTWSDGNKLYKYTFSDSQIWQKFESDKYDSIIVDKFDVKIIEDPFSFILKAYSDLIDTSKEIEQDIVEVYLPLYSYSTQKVEDKSGLNAWNAAPKNKGSNTLRPLNEIYIPIPIDFHKKHPDFFTENIFEREEIRAKYSGSKDSKPEVRFQLQLPNGKKIPSLVTQDNMKALQSGSKTERDENGKKYGQSALGQWLLLDVLGLKDREVVTRDWLDKKGTDSVRLWRKIGDYSIINIDFAELDSFEAFINDNPMP
ncbi:MAG: NgoFVII family restriction endonuclease [Kangiella sp.]|nr:MAG: NgoFVII family restriction endonuclease [Kangiella sp.]